MLFLPVEADAPFFRVCLYYGLLVLVLEVAIPLLFHRRVRLVLPRLAVQAPAAPMPAREFQQRRQALQRQILALQQAIAATPHRSPQKRRQQLSPSASEKRPTTSPSPSPSPSPPASSLKTSTSRRPQSLRKSSDSKRRTEQPVGKKEEKSVERRKETDGGIQRNHAAIHSTASVPSWRPPPMALGLPLTRRESSRSVDSLVEKPEEGGDEKELPQERYDLEEMLDAATVRRKQLLALPSRIPIGRFARSGGNMRRTENSKASSELEMLIGSRKRRTNSPELQDMQPSTSPEPPVAATANSSQQRATQLSSLKGHMSSQADLQRQGAHQEMKEKKTEDNEDAAPSHFKAFCSTFATQGAAATRPTAEKRDHDQAFGFQDERPPEKCDFSHLSLAGSTDNHEANCNLLRTCIVFTFRSQDASDSQTDLVRR
ncbi:hypothetical protein BBJ28_00002733 [Nothophytophthora sp. Chile5]|nr:hypothetical protein BBJ28_00002733 [Nothophytophthora sp. Chile5]